MDKLKIEGEAATGREASVVERLVMCKYSQGICDDGAAILKDGEIMNIDEIVKELRSGQAATGLCAIYFTIAAESIGETRVRELRDEAINALST